MPASASFFLQLKTYKTMQDTTFKDGRMIRNPRKWRNQEIERVARGKNLEGEEGAGLEKGEELDGGEAGGEAEE